MSHTAKLKRKAQESEGTTNLDESFVSIGTPLPSLSSSKRDQNDFLPIWQQEVRDEKGRRRLHGAFTGGFSAGYFNTVGSKEGWQPSQFKSSRGGVADGGKGKGKQRVEDFMDEEDLEELRNAKEMKTNQRFAEAAEPGQRNYDPFAHLGSGTAGKPSSAPLALGDRADAAFADLIKPSTSRAGEKILQKMGWKPGQGIGPRVTRKRRLQVAKQLGVTLGGDDDGEAEDTEDDKHLYAPVDRPLILFQARSGTAGLGYTKAPTLRSDLDRLATGGYRGGGEVDGKKMPQGASFGLGALNDAEIDDEDPYATGSGPAFASDPRASRLLVDDSEDAHLTPFSSRKTGPQPPPTAAPAGYFSDGKPMVKGFVLASEKRKEDTWYKAPEPPRNWEPDPRAMWERIKMGQLGAMRPSGPSTGPLNADERGHILGEEPVKAPPRSVFDFLSAKDKARLEAIKASGGKPVPASGGAAPAQPDVPSVELKIPFLDPSVARSALQGFMPFAHDPARQSRYRLYLQSQAHSLPDGVVFAPKPAAGQRMEQVNKELEDFSKSALMFKPMSAAMASRFTSAGASAAAGEMKQPAPGLRQPVFEPAPPVEERAADPGKEVEEQEVSTAAQAVRSGMFGMLTRTTTDFYPERLVCKRFNVPDPHPDGRPVEVPRSKMDDFLASQGYHNARPAESTPAQDVPIDNDPEEKLADETWTAGNSVPDGPPKPLGQVGLGDDETQGRDTLTATRPSMDLFKAIFGDSDAEEEDEEVESENVPPAATVKGPAARPDPDEDETVAAPPLESRAELPKEPLAYSSVPTVINGGLVASMASFRPTFKRKSEREADDLVGVAKPKKHKKRPVIMSFGDEEDAGDEDSGALKAKHKKGKNGDKKRKDRKEKKDKFAEEDEEMVWVEKEPTAIPAKPPTRETAEHRSKARALAADFMD